ncbi:MAG: ComEC/Rec2 family competence protein, partial [Pseudomonadota bacterium]|nr:ComEC/Rec2 family competence protein [Pseudomonadota bacterium]
MKRLFQDVLTEYKSFGDLFALAFMVGICIFFWGWNPPVTVLIFLILLTGLLSISKRAYLFKPIGILLFSFFCGIMVAALRFETVNSPILDHPISQAEVIGTVHQISESPDGQTLILSDVRLPNHIFISLPKNVQLKHKSVFPRFQIGDVIHVRANLRPPRLPSAPGFYNEARTLYFRQVGATGYIDTVLSIRYGGISPNRIIENIRLHIRNRIRQILPSGPADIAIPLTIGDQNSVSPKLYDLFRTAGIVHILSVSGFHLSLLAIWAFFLCRGILSFFPTLSAYLSAKKISATVALIIVGGYVLISGMQIPAIRSFIMLGIMIGAIFVNRSSLSFRSLSVAALLILLFRPEYVFHIGFQLSFTAVLILISLYHSFEGHFLVPLKSTRIKWLIRPIIGLAIASAFITLATLPLTAYHFNQIAPYSILGNVLTGIILSFWIMPCLFLGLCLMPLGGDALFLKAGGMGLSYIIT